jgi:site-specific DNA-cytosine methylase
VKEYTAFFPCCGAGGAAIGAQRAVFEFKGQVGFFRVVGGIDVDPEACLDFENLTGATAHCMDLFSRDDYIAFHGHEPPEDWHEVTPVEIRRLVEHVPDVIFVSAPCQGNSGLLPEGAAQTDKYQALNNLAYHIMWLMVEAFRDDPVPVFLFENVPRITTRSASLLNRIRMMLKSHGYETHPQKDKDGYHDCGVVGGLGQHRKRYMMASRHREKCNAIIYRPPRQKMKSIGDVLGTLYMPDDPVAGPMHRLPRLTWKTWVRLAFIRAGGDWRDLENCGPYRIEHVPRDGVFSIADWDQASKAIIAHARPGGSNGVAAVADPRLNPRETRHPNVYQVIEWNQSGPTITGSKFGSGAGAVADPRLNLGEGTHQNIYRVVPWGQSAPTVTGALGVNNGALAVADARLGCKPRNGSYKVQDWNRPSSTVTASGDVHAGSSAVADPRIPLDHERLDPVPIIIAVDGSWHRPLTDYENAALQSFPLTMPNGSPLLLAGNSSARWRKRIGNAVPPDSAQAWFETVGISLLASDKAEWFLSAAGIWVVNRDENTMPYTLCH